MSVTAVGVWVSDWEVTDWEREGGHLCGRQPARHGHHVSRTGVYFQTTNSPGAYWVKQGTNYTVDNR